MKNSKNFHNSAQVQNCFHHETRFILIDLNYQSHSIYLLVGYSLDYSVSNDEKTLGLLIKVAHAVRLVYFVLSFDAAWY